MSGVRIGMPGEDDARPLDEVPFRVALIGDFSGRGSRGIVESADRLAGRRVFRVDRDDLDLVLRKLAPAVRLELEPGAAITVQLSGMDDFHPDQLLHRLPAFQALRALRQRLLDPSTFRDTAAALTGERPALKPPAPGEAGILSAILEEAVPATGAEAMAQSGGDLQAFIRQVMRPHLVPNPDPRQGQLVAQTDAALSATMRAVLHHADFQALEALWRAVELLAFRLDTGSDLQLHLVDLSAAELTAALPADGDPSASPLYRLLAGQAREAPWAVLAGAFTFGADSADVERLAQLAAIGHLLGAPWIAAAHPRLVGADSLAVSPDPRDWKPAADPAWEAFRGLALARSVGLVLPRFLLRPPYGRRFETCERFQFEEFDEEPFHEQYLWGPPAFAVALLLARAFSERGWGLAQAIEPELEGLPFVVFGRGAEAEAVPCAEALLTERAASRILDRGIMPLATLKDQDRIRLIRLQSVARPLAPLAARWAGRA
jgi:type VI secretion system ImpC/EvpB family protein/type VI secretion system ImpB/VipA family protein